MEEREKVKWVVYVDGGIKPDRDGNPARWKFEFDEFHRKQDAEKYAKKLNKSYENVVLETMRLSNPSRFQIVN